MRILVQALVAAPGGSLTVLRDLVAAWPEDDDLLLVCWRKDAAEVLRETGHPVLQVRARSTEHALLRLRFERSAGLARFRPDVVWSQAVRVGGYSVPQAVHYRDIGSFVPIHPGSLRQRVKSLRERRDLRRADLRIYNSSTMRDAVHARYPEADLRPNVVVHNGLDLTPFGSERIEPADAKRDRTEWTVLLPQMDAPHKRNWLAADILALLRDRDLDRRPIRLRVVGRGDYRDLCARLEQHGLKEAATFTGFVPREEVAGLYATSDAVLMTGRAESFGNPIVEAHATGRPVVTPQFPVAIELSGPLSHVASGDDAPALADALHRALTTRIDQENVREARLFAEAFTARTAAQSLAGALRSMTSVTDPSRAAESDESVIQDDR